jgi:hypothetical protein
MAARYEFPANAEPCTGVTDPGFQLVMLYDFFWGGLCAAAVANDG